MVDMKKTEELYWELIRDTERGFVPDFDPDVYLEIFINFDSVIEIELIN